MGQELSSEALTPHRVRTEAKNTLENTVFMRRREFIEREGLTLPRHAERIPIGDGGLVRVIWSMIDLQKVNEEIGIKPIPSKDRTSIHISVMNAGLFEATSVQGFSEGTANTGNTEIKLASGLFSGSDGFVPDAIVFVKPEGLNAQAFAKGQSLVGEATAIQLSKVVQSYKETHAVPNECNVVFDLTGYSEGSTQILSVAKAIHERNIGSIRRVLSIGGAGFVGADQGEKAHPLAFVGQAAVEKQMAKDVSMQYGPMDRDRTSLGVRQNGRVVVPDVNIPAQAIQANRDILTRYSKGNIPLPIQEGGTGSERIVLNHDVKNILRFGKRLVKTAIGNAEEGAAVPWRRIKEVCALNSDREYLAANSISTMVFTDYEDPFFPPRLIQQEVESLRQKHTGANIWVVASKLGHYGPHYEQTTFNWLVEMLQKSWDRRMNTVQTGASE